MSHRAVLGRVESEEDSIKLVTDKLNRTHLLPVLIIPPPAICSSLPLIPQFLLSPTACVLTSEVLITLYPSCFSSPSQVVGCLFQLLRSSSRGDHDQPEKQ
jgi:hypothetical protein